MFDLGMQELIVIFAIALLVFGPKRLPELGRTIGKGMRELKAALRGVQESIEEAGTDITADITKEIKDTEKSIKDDITKTLLPEVSIEEKEKRQETEHPETSEKEQGKDGN